jgi:signal transduction histidine kinase/DNA-binding response OmpR family regulator
MSLKQLFNRYAYAGCLADDSPQQKLQKAIMVIAPSLLSFFCVFWVTGYYLMDKPLSAAIPGGYAIVSMISVLVFFKTRHYAIFRFSQLLFIMCLPFLLQASLGGFRAGSAVQMWAMLAPVGALMFQGTRAASWWFAVFVGLTILSGFSEGYLSSHIEPLPGAAITAFFALNFICAFFLIFSSVYYYVSENKRILAIINEQTSKLMQMDQIKNRFFANLSHEFRTPLALTIGPLEDAIRGQFGDIDVSLRNQLEVMLRNSRRLLRLINQLLDISKIESGEMKLDTGHYDIRQLANDTCLAFTPFAERNGVLLSAETGDQPISFDFDYVKMEHIFNNLLSNAIKFTPENGKVMLILTQTDSPHRGVLLRVRDTGTGIEIDNTEKIFDRFYQVDGSSSRDYEGTGIGLSLVKELVELHDGAIEVKSDPGFGTEFSVFIPGNVSNRQGEHHSVEESNVATELAILETSATEGEEKADAIGAGDGETERATVLVVDDNSDIRNYLNTCLKSTFRILQARDGAEGIKLAQENRPDLIVSDIMMPGVDGYQLCRAIREDENLRHTPVIFLTAKASDEMKLEGLEIGADDYLAKPFNARELLARSKNLINLRQKEKEVKQLNRVLEQKLKDQLEELVNSKKLSNYFSRKILQRILSADATLDTERRNITILFVDLCGFTDMTDRIESEKVARLLNQYLSEVVSLVEQHGATLIQVIGDSIMVFLGAPDEMDDTEQAERALNLSIAIQHKVGTLAKDWLQNGLEYEGPARIGIHQDYVTVGNFGSENLMEYTAVGRGINLASRLEASCTPGCIKVSYPVYLLTKDRFDYGEPVEENFKGLARKIRVCELDPRAVAQTGD